MSGSHGHLTFDPNWPSPPQHWLYLWGRGRGRGFSSAPTWNVIINIFVFCCYLSVFLSYEVYTSVIERLFSCLGSIRFVIDLFCCFSDQFGFYVSMVYGGLLVPETQHRIDFWIPFFPQLTLKKQSDFFSKMTFWSRNYMIIVLSSGSQPAIDMFCLSLCVIVDSVMDMQPSSFFIGSFIFLRIQGFYWHSEEFAPFKAHRLYVFFKRWIVVYFRQIVLKW